MPESPEAFYSRGAEKFAEKNSFENMPQEYIDLLDQFIELVQGDEVLDAGCGHGRDTNYFTENGLDTIGIDVAGGMLEYARENQKGEYLRMDVRELEFEDNRFDGLWCNTVLLFFPIGEMRDVIKELSRVTKDDGVIFVSFKIGESPIMREKYGSEVKHHLIPEEKAIDLLESEDLEIIDVYRYETGGGFKVADIFCRN